MVSPSSTRLAQEKLKLRPSSFEAWRKDERKKEGKIETEGFQGWKRIEDEGKRAGWK